MDTNLKENVRTDLVATILIYSTREWEMVYSSDIDPIIKAACEAQMYNNWDDEIERAENDHRDKVKE